MIVVDTGPLVAMANAQDRHHVRCVDWVRQLTDDVFSARFGWLTLGKVLPDGLGAHADLLADFPYLGPPSP